MRDVGQEKKRSLFACRVAWLIEALSRVKVMMVQVFTDFASPFLFPSLTLTYFFALSNVS